MLNTTPERVAKRTDHEVEPADGSLHHLHSAAQAASDDRAGCGVTGKRQAELLELSRSNVYYQARPVSERDLRLMRRIDGLHLEAVSFQRNFLLC
jgi:hypothetical protein